jgi:UDP-N-acetylmuramate--alanine ligase
LRVYLVEKRGERLKKKHLHFMGIGGQGISAVAQIAHLTGEMVTGCDRGVSPTVKDLQQQGIAVQVGHSADHLDGVDTLVISPAVPALDPQNSELLAARALGVPIVTWQELLGQFMQGKCVLSVSGVHGKSTTTSLLSLILTDAGLDPTCMVGAVVPRFGANYRLGNSKYFVNEADEFNHNFWHYHPRLTIVKSIEYEHPEFFTDYEMFLAAFEHFVRGMDMDGNWPLPQTLLVNADNAGCIELLGRLRDWSGRVLTFSVEGSSGRDKSGPYSTGNELLDDVSPMDRDLIDCAHPLLSEPPAFEAYDVKLDGETSFRVRVRVGEAFPERVIHLRLPGVFNVENALSALAAAHCLGVPADAIIATLEGFGGSRRRFDIQHEGLLQLRDGRIDNVMLVDDYAHHPTAIAVTLEGACRRYSERRLVAVYQPHMYSRTKTFFAQFLEAFDVADVVIIADIFPARERDTGLVHSRDLVAALAQRAHFAQGAAQVYYGGDVDGTAQMLASLLCSGDLAVIMGAGDVYSVTDQLLHPAQGEAV